MKLLFSLLIIVPFALLAQTKEKPKIRYYDFNGHQCKQKNAGYLQKTWKENGEWKVFQYYYPSNILSREASFKDEDLEIPNGYFVNYFENGNKSSEGKFSEGKKNGIFQTWAENGTLVNKFFYADNSFSDTGYLWNLSGKIYKKQLIDNKGNGEVFTFYESGKMLCSFHVSNGKKNGEVFYYDETGKIAGKKIFIDDSIISDSCFSQYTTDTAQDCKNQEYPQFTGGEEAWKKYLEKNLQYPEFAQENGIMGVVKAIFTVGENGSIIDISIISSPHHSLSEETIRIIKNSPSWSPATIYNQAISMTGTQSITFRLQ